MAEIIDINTPNPHDITPAEAEEIAEAIRRLNPTYEVTVTVTERTGYGITWFEILRISLAGGAFAGKEAMKEAAKKVADIVVEWARERFKREKPAVNPRPIYVAIYGPDGTVISRVIKNATDEPEDRTEYDQKIERDFRERK
jgi:hypothetical protein